MTKINVNTVLGFSPCENYNRDAVKALADENEEITYEDLCSLSIPHSDKVWLLSRLITTEQLTTWVFRAVDRVVESRCLHCNSPKIEEWATNWISTLDRTEESARRAALYFGLSDDTAKVESAMRAVQMSYDITLRKALASLLAAAAASDDTDVEKTQQLTDFLEIKSS